MTKRRYERHGATGQDLAESSLYRVWRSMMYRCMNETAEVFHNYGERGISVCQEWQSSFLSFEIWALENGYRPGLTLDRANNNAGYGPDNCRWVSMQTQCENKRNNCFLEIDGVRRTIKGWADATGIPYRTLYYRYHKGVRGKEIFAPPKPGIPLKK